MTATAHRLGRCREVSLRGEVLWESGRMGTTTPDSGTRFKVIIAGALALFVWQAVSLLTTDRVAGPLLSMTGMVLVMYACAQSLRKRSSARDDGPVADQP